MVNFVATLSKLTNLLWKIYVKSTLALIINSEAVFTANDMLNALALS